MSGIVEKTVSLGQANGPDVELVVTGTALYATYETLQGYPVVYDDSLGQFCYARVVDGSFQSLKVPVTAAAPAGLERHAKEHDDVRAAKLKLRQAQLEKRTHSALRNNVTPQKE